MMEQASKEKGKKKDKDKRRIEIYEFEPVKQKNGVSFVSPVTRSDLNFN